MGLPRSRENGSIQLKNILLSLLFIARVTIPWGIHTTYDNVETVFVEQTNYKLFLTDGRMVLVPTMFTVIDEVKK